MVARYPLSVGLYALSITSLVLFQAALAVAVAVVPPPDNNAMAVAASGDGISTPLLIPRQDPNQNYFTYPPGLGPHLDFQDDRTFAQGSQINITWETGLPATDLILAQPALDGSYGQFRLAANITQRFFVWNVTYSDVTTLAGPVGNVFFFQIRPPSQANPTYNSHYFNITDRTSDDPSGNPPPNSANTPPETSSPSSSATKNNNPPSSSSPVSTEQSGSAPSADSSTKSSGLSPATIGAICAAFVGGFLIAAAFVWWLLVFRRRRRRQRRARSKVYVTGADSRFSSTSGGSDSPPQELFAVSPVQEIGSKPPAHEVETREVPAELPDTPTELP